jgi:hypothetical protein
LDKYYESLYLAWGSIDKSFSGSASSRCFTRAVSTYFERRSRAISSDLRDPQGNFAVREATLLTYPMAIRFRQDKNILMHDLERRGFEVAFVRQYSNGPGRTVDICLENGVRVYWDRHSQFVWAEGPAALAEKVEAHLRRRYDSGVVTQLFAAGLSACRAGVIWHVTWMFLAKQFRRWKRRIDDGRVNEGASVFSEPEAYRLQTKELGTMYPPVPISLESQMMSSTERGLSGGLG